MFDSSEGRIREDRKKPIRESGLKISGRQFRFRSFCYFVRAFMRALRISEVFGCA
jgi:hypothetical protein